MSNPEIDISWKSCFWRRSHRRLVRPFVEGAIELAHQTAEYIGIDYSQPKIAQIKRCGNSYPAVAENEDATGFSLFIRVDDYRRRKVEKKFGAYVVASVHELTHAARYERFAGWNLIEEIASEGLAHVAEDIASSELGLTEQSFFMDLESCGYSNHHQTKSELVTQIEEANGSEELADIMMDRWFNWSSPYLDEGSVFGIIEVNRRLAEGNTINELLDWPPEKVLDL
ncbi:MAG: hypothetical protein H6793_01235 [Candidatus Nomurabacteria bacterium]|nr:hypothetical protein [Candidatus Saccharibacteria bacterium]USN95768.1 MAG: hypothetical protein H6793_01235 [Candidatus Nomurabacteria bacterium]